MHPVTGDQYIMQNGRYGCQRRDGSLRLHFDTPEQAAQCADFYGWDEVPELCHCGYYHLNPRSAETAKIN